ncbi:MAG TPA: NAD-dependent epimerase, partial [Acidobacteriota bacterium]|nr:NAD-dependent epimerase [Acidobacteriota bacterium]
SLERFFGHLERISKVNAPRLHVKKSMHIIASKVIEGIYDAIGKAPPVDPISMEMSRYFWYCKSAKATRELGFAPRDPNETLYDTIQYLRTRFLGKGVFA